jgi:hypothetical protein
MIISLKYLYHICLSMNEKKTKCIWYNYFRDNIKMLLRKYTTHNKLQHIY